MPIPPVATDIGIPEDGSLEAYAAELGSTVVPDESFYAAEEEAEPIEDIDLSGDTGRLGQLYRSPVMGFLGGLAGIPKSLGIAADRLDNVLGLDLMGDPREGILYGLGDLIEGAGEVITPDQSEVYGDSFGWSVAPHAVGNMLSFVVGTKGLGAGFKAATVAAKGGSRAAARGVIKGARKKVTARADKLRKKRTDRGLKPDVRGLSPASIRKVAKAAAKKDAAKQTGHLIAGGSTMGWSLGSVEGWEDAMRVLEARAAAEGRELTDAEREMAWKSYKYNGFIGLSEMLPVWGFLKHLDKFVPGSKSRLRHVLTTGTTEALQEFGQSTAFNYIAAHSVGYDKARDLWEGAGTAAGAGGVAGAVMGLISFAVGRRGRFIDKAKKHRENAKRLQESGSSPAQVQVEIRRAQEIEAMLGRIDVESGAAAERAKEEKAKEPGKSEETVAAPTEETAPTEAVVPTEGAASTEEVSPLSKSRRFKQTIPVEEEAAPVEAEEVAAAPATEEAAKPTKNPVAKNVLDNKTLMARAKKHGIDPADAPVGKKGKVTLGTLRQFIKDKIAAEGTEAEGVDVGDSALREAMAEEEASPPEEVAPVDAGSTATDYSDMGGADVGAAPAKDAAALLAESIASTTEATAGAVESADARDAAAHEAIRDRAAESIADSEAVLAKAGELVPVEGTEGEHRVTNESGRTFSLVENARGDVTVYDGNEIEILHRADSLEEAQAAVNSGDLDAIHDAKTLEDGAEDQEASAPVAEEEAVDPDAELGEDEHSRTNAGTGEVFDTAAEARASERAELEEDNQADMEEPDIVVQGGVSFDLSKLTTEERGSDEVKTVMANVAAKFKGAENEVGAKPGHFYVRITMEKLEGGGAAEADVYGNLREITVSVPGTTEHLKGHDNLQRVLSEEMWHQLDATAVRFAYDQEVEAGTIDPDEVSYVEYYNGHYIDVADGMSAKERQESITRYHHKSNVDSENNEMSRLEQEAQQPGSSEAQIATRNAARRDLNQKKINIAREYVRMLLQQRSEGTATEASYGISRKVKPVLGKLMRMLRDFYTKLTGDWPMFGLSPQAMNRVKEAEAIAELLKKDAVRVEVNYESGTDEGGRAGAARADAYTIETTPAVDERISQSKTDNEALEVIANESPSAEARTLAEGLLEGTTEAAALSFKPNLNSQMAGSASKTWGAYSTRRHSIEVSRTSPSLTGVTLHEAAHAKAIRKISNVVQDSMDRLGLFEDHGGERARTYDNTSEWLEVISEQAGKDASFRETPVSREELAAAELHWMYNRLRLRDDFKRENFYGATNLDEMIAEAWSNPTFRNYLKGIKVSELGLDNFKGGVQRERGVSRPANLWGTFKQAVADVLGLNIEQANVLDRVMDSSSTVMEAETGSRKDWRSFGDVFAKGGRAGAAKAGPADLSRQAAPLPLPFIHDGAKTETETTATDNQAGLGSIKSAVEQLNGSDSRGSAVCKP